MKLFSPDKKSFSEIHDLQEWRTYVLNGILRGIFVLWIFALVGGVNNVIEAYQQEKEIHENPLTIATSVIAVYVVTTIILTLITFVQKLGFALRAGALLLILYALGAIGLALSSFSGDGRLLLFAFIILSAVFFDLRYSLTALFAAFFTLALVGRLQVTGAIVVPAERQVNSTDVGAWISGSAVFLMLSIAALISITYLLRALGKSLLEARDALKRERRLSHILRTISGVNQIIVRERDQNILLKRVCENLISGRGYSFAWIGLLEKDGNTLQLAASAGEEIDPSEFAFKLDSKEGGAFCGVNVLRSGAPLLISPGKDDPCLSCPRLNSHPFRRAVALPLLRDERKLGVLVVDHVDPASFFDQEEVALLQGLSEDLSYAIEKIDADRRLNDTARRLDIQNRITRLALEIQDMKAMSNAVVGFVCKLIDADASYIVLWDEETNAPIPIASFGSFQDSFLSAQFTVEEIQNAALLLQEGKPLVVDDVTKNQRIGRRIAAEFSIKSVLGMPLIAYGRKYGGVFLTFDEPHRFSEDEIKIVEQTAGQIALAVARSRAYEETRSKASELGSLYAAAQDLATSMMDPPALLEKLARHMTEALKATSGYIVSMNLAASSMQVVAEYWSEAALPIERHSDLRKTYPNSEYSTIVGAISAGIVLTLHADTGNSTEAERKQFKEYGIQSMMFVPIMAHGQLFGNIEIWESRRKREFTLAEIHLAQAMAGHAASIIQNADLVNALRTSEVRYRTLIEQASDGIFIADAQRHYVEVNSAGCQMLGYSRDEILNMTMNDLAAPEDILSAPFRMQELIDGKTVINERMLRRKDGSLLPVEISAKMLLNGNLQGIVRDITERKLAEKVLAEREAYFRALIENSAEGVAILDAQGNIRYIAPSEERLTGYSVDEVQGNSAFRYIHPDDLPNVLKIFMEGMATSGTVQSVQYRLMHKSGEWHYYEVTGHNMLDDPHVAGIVANYRDITERKQAEDALRASERKFRALAENIPSVVYLYKNDNRCTMIYLNDSIEELTGYSKKEFLEEGLSFRDLYHPDDLALISPSSHTETANTNKGSFHITYRIRHKSGGWRWVDEWGVGVLDDVGTVQYLEGVMIDITERKHVEEVLLRRAHELEALTAASAALRTAQNVTEMIPVLARQALRAVGGDYSSIFLLEPESGDYVSQGWYSANSESEKQLSDEAYLRHRPGEGVTGRVALTGEIYVMEDMHKDPHVFILSGEKNRMKDLHSGISLPLRAQEEIIGVLHVWTSTRHKFSEMEIRLLTALAETAGNAIHRAMLFEQTLQHADELSLAYDNTLAGWARALELRDEITEGHTRRVTELTLQLARALNIPENELVQIHRGALLHDIGKMGIPDSILHKPGPFTVQERAIMQRHPQYAHDMLSTIPFLQSALDIPFYHHEHWDGNGYPRKLMGEQIPLAARIFSVVDVWDALTSDRPYRMAWSKEKAREYIIERAGKQFDPHIVEAFFSLVLDEN